MITGQNGLNADVQGFLLGQRRLADAINTMNAGNQQIIDLLTLINQSLNNSTPPLPPSPPIPPTQDVNNPSPVPPDTTDIRTAADLARARAAARRQRDANGRFQGEGQSDQSIGDQVSNSVKDGLKDIGQDIDTKGVDPTVDAVHELGTLLSPIKGLASFMMKPLDWFGGKDEEVPAGQQRHNNMLIKLMKKLVGKAKDAGSGLMSKLMLMLPMLLAGIAGLGATVLAGITAAAPLMAVAIGSAVTLYLAKKAGEAIHKSIDDTEFGRSSLDNGVSLVNRALVSIGLGNKDLVDLENENMARRNGGDSIAGSADENHQKVIDSYIRAGATQSQAVALAAQVGREGDFQSKNMFGGHRDAGKGNLSNLGIHSWQGERKTALEKAARKEGLLMPDGTIQQSQAGLDFQTRFALNEIRTKYPKVQQSLDLNKNNEPETMIPQLDNYEGWAKGQDRLADGKPFDWRAHVAKQQRYVERGKVLLNKRSEKDVPSSVDIVDTAMPQGIRIGVDPDVPSGAPLIDARIGEAKPISTKRSAAGSIRQAKTVAAMDISLNQRQAPKVTPQPTLPKVRDRVSSPLNKTVIAQQQSDNIAQNVGDRDIAHSATGGLGGRSYYG